MSKSNILPPDKIAIKKIKEQIMSNCTVYIDESGDLGVGRGTRWFVLSAVAVDKQDESQIRATLCRIKSRLNVNSIHLRKISDYYRRAFIIREISNENFTYFNVIADTKNFDRTKISSPEVAYNYLCRMLLERVSWFLRDTGRTADVVLSARGTKRDGELISYIKDKLLPYPGNQIAPNTIEKICAKQASQWDLLQLADICATSMFLAYEVNTWGFCVPCFSRVLESHLYTYNGKIDSYGIKYFTSDMKPCVNELRDCWICTKKERTPGATTT